MNKHTDLPLSVHVTGGIYPTIQAGMGKSLCKKVCEIEWLGDREETIATALLFAQSPAMFNVLQQLLQWKAEEFENEEPISGADAVEFLDQLRGWAHEALAPYMNHPVLNQKDGLAYADRVEGG